MKEIRFENREIDLYAMMIASLQRAGTAFETWRDSSQFVISFFVEEKA